MRIDSKYLVIGVFIAIIVVAALLFKDKLPFLVNKSSTPSQKVTLRVNWLNQAQYAGVFTAIEKGFYQDEGIGLEVKEYEEGLDQMEEVANGEVDFAIATGVEIVSAIDKGADIKALATIYQTSPESFISLKSSDVTSPSKFRGKVLGKKGGNLEAGVSYKSLLNKFGINESEVTIKDLDYSTSVSEDLTNGIVDVIDAYRTDQVRQFELQGIAYNIIEPEKYGASMYGDSLIASNGLIERDPELVKKFVQATLKGWEYALSHQDEALKYTSKYENEQYSDKDLEKFIFEKSAPLIKPTRNSTVGEMNFISWSRIVKELTSSGILKKKVESNSVFTSQFIKK